jgi:hypothetical protein
MAMKCIEMTDWKMVAVPPAFSIPLSSASASFSNVAPEAILPPMG